MFNKFFSIAVAAVCVAPCLAADGWILDDFEAAKKQATEQNKGILIEFTGSDWCRPCMMLRSNVLNKDEFKNAAGQDFILLELDYPSRKPQTPEVKEANKKLADLYKVGGYPTVVFADAEGRPYSFFVGNQSMNAAKDYLANARKKKKIIDEAEAKLAAAKTDDERIDAMALIVKQAPKAYAENFYGAIKKQLLELDKNDRSGLKNAGAIAAKAKAQLAEVNAFLKEQKVNKTTPENYLKALREYPNRDRLLPQVQQELYMSEFNILINRLDDIDGAIEVLKKVVELDPESSTGARAVRIIYMLEENKEKIKARREEDAKRMKENK